MKKHLPTILAGAAGLVAGIALVSYAGFPQIGRLKGITLPPL